MRHWNITLPNGRAARVVLRSCAEAAASELAGEAYTTLLADQPNRSIACRVYERLAGHAALAVPLFLSHPAWLEENHAPVRTRLGDTADYTPLARYSSNSGSAIGGSPDEATVHAINETIERDAMSLFLIRSVAAATPSPLAFLDPATLPVELQTLLDQVQFRTEREVWLIDITTDLAVPTTLAYSPGRPGDHLRGYGTSLSRHHGVFRALTELLQCHLADEGIVDVQRLNAIEALVCRTGSPPYTYTSPDWSVPHDRRRTHGWSISTIPIWAAVRATPVRTAPSRAAPIAPSGPSTKTRIRR